MGIYDHNPGASGGATTFGSDAVARSATVANKAKLDTLEATVTTLDNDNATQAELDAVALQIADKVDKAVYDAYVAGNATDAEVEIIRKALQDDIDAISVIETDPVYMTDKPGIALKSEVTAEKNRATAAEALKADKTELHNAVTLKIGSDPALKINGQELELTLPANSTVDTVLSSTSDNALANKAIQSGLDKKSDKIDATGFSDNSLGLKPVDDTLQKVVDKLNAYISSAGRALKSVTLANAGNLATLQALEPTVTIDDFLFEFDTSGALSYTVVPLDLFIDTGAYVSSEFKALEGETDENIIVFTTLDGTKLELDLTRFTKNYYGTVLGLGATGNIDLDSALVDSPVFMTHLAVGDQVLSTASNIRVKKGDGTFTDVTSYTVPAGKIVHVTKNLIGYLLYEQDTKALAVSDDYIVGETGAIGQIRTINVPADYAPIQPTMIPGTKWAVRIAVDPAADIGTTTLLEVAEANGDIEPLNQFKSGTVIQTQKVQGPNTARFDYDNFEDGDKVEFDFTETATNKFIELSNVTTFEFLDERNALVTDEALPDINVVTPSRVVVERQNGGHVVISYDYIPSQQQPLSLERNIITSTANTFQLIPDRYSWLSSGAAVGDTITMPTFTGWSNTTDERMGVAHNISGIDLPIVLPAGYTGVNMPTLLADGDVLHWRQTGPTHVTGYISRQPVTGIPENARYWDSKSALGDASNLITANFVDATRIKVTWTTTFWAKNTGVSRFIHVPVIATGGTQVGSNTPNCSGWAEPGKRITATASNVYDVPAGGTFTADFSTPINNASKDSHDWGTITIEGH